MEPPVRRPVSWPLAAPTMLLRCRASGLRTASGSLACHARAGVPRRAHRQLFTPTLHALQRKQCVPYSSEQVYAVVADVERYVEFLPFCSASRICARHGPASFDATLALGFLAFSETYTSRVTLEPPRGVTAVATAVPSPPGLKGSVGERPNQSNFSDQNSV